MTPSRPAPSNSENHRSAMVAVGGRRSEVNRRAGAGHRVDQRGAAFVERPAGVVVVAEREQVERDERRRCLLGEHPDPRCRPDGCAVAAPRNPGRVAPRRRSPRRSRIARAVRPWPPRPVRGSSGSVGRSLRLPSSTWSPSRKQIDRKPSHFGSYQAPGGIVATDLASIGETGGMTGRSIGPLNTPAGESRGSRDDIARSRWSDVAWTQ